MDLHEELSELRSFRADMMNEARPSVAAYDQFGFFGCLRFSRAGIRIREILEEMRSGR